MIALFILSHLEPLAMSTPQPSVESEESEATFSDDDCCEFETWSDSDDEEDEDRASSSITRRRYVNQPRSLQKFTGSILYDLKCGSFLLSIYKKSLKCYQNCFIFVKSFVILETGQHCIA